MVRELRPTESAFKDGRLCKRGSKGGRLVSVEIETEVPHIAEVDLLLAVPPARAHFRLDEGHGAPVGGRRKSGLRVELRVNS